MSLEKDPDADGLVLGERFQAILTGSWKTQALYVAAELRLADLLAEGPKTSAELAASTGADVHALHRLLRALTSFDICAEREDGSFALTPLGALLRDDSSQSLRAWTLWWGKYLWPVWGNLLHSVRTGQSARKLLFGTDGFAHLDKDPEAAATFYRVTIELTRETAQLVTRAYDFSGLRQIVDVGGGYGELLAQVLAANPGASGILFDLPRAVEGAADNFEKNHADLGGRCSFAAGDFFESIPAGADAYMLKSVIHDWNDERSIRIMQNIRQAMAENSRLLIIEPIMPARDAEPSRRATFARQDLTMLVALGAQERSEAEFSKLLAAADLRISRIVPAGPISNVIEAVPAGSA
jgi:SAM-dependent methyltransferase